jgi:hypothetical protein
VLPRKNTNLFNFTFLEVGKKPKEDFVRFFEVASVDAGHLGVEVDEDGGEAEAVLLLDVPVRTFDQLNLFLLKLVVDFFKLKINYDIHSLIGFFYFL